MSGFETQKQTSLLRQNGNLVKRNEGAPRTEGEAGQAGCRLQAARTWDSSGVSVTGLHGPALQGSCGFGFLC